jgi:hypothetical protein
MKRMLDVLEKITILAPARNGITIPQSSTLKP